MHETITRLRTSWRHGKAQARAWIARYLRPILLLAGPALLVAGVLSLLSAYEAYRDDQSFPKSTGCETDALPGCYAMWPGTIVDKFRDFRQRHRDLFELRVESATRRTIVKLINEDDYDSVHEGETVFVVQYHGHQIGVVRHDVLLPGEMWPDYRESEDTFYGAAFAGIGLAMLLAGALNLTSTARLRSAPLPLAVGVYMVALVPMSGMLGWVFLGTRSLALVSVGVGACFFGVTFTRGFSKLRRDAPA